MNERRLKRLLVAAPPPDEIGAQRRSWRVARTAFGEREPSPWPIRHRRPLTAAAVGVGILAAALTPPGQAVIGGVRDAVGTEKVVGVPQARPALFSLPTRGRVLVAAPSGAWVVSADGSRRRLGAYDEATWSPQGRFVGVSKRSELAAVTPTGQVRWALSRRGVRAPRWSPSGFRVAYLSGNTLRVVAGDGTGDRRVDAAQDVAPAWMPGTEHVLAYADRNGTVNVMSTDDGAIRWTAAGSAASPSKLEWSSDGERLLVVRRLEGGRTALVVFDGDGRRRQYLELEGIPIRAAFSPRGHRFALVRRIGPRSELLVAEADTLRRQTPVFSGRGRFSDVAWSPGRTLVAPRLAERRPVALHPLGKRQPGFRGLAPGRAVRSGQDEPPGFPRIQGWCCPS